LSSQKSLGFCTIFIFRFLKQGLYAGCNSTWICCLTIYLADQKLNIKRLSAAQLGMEIARWQCLETPPILRAPLMPFSTNSEKNREVKSWKLFSCSWNSLKTGS